MASWLAKPAHWCLVLVAVFLLAAAAIGPIERKGDSSEYILATESLLYDNDLIFDPAVDVRRNAMMRPEGLLDIPGGLAGMNGTDGKTRYGLHSFYYSLAVVPLYAVLGYRAFLVFNAICVFVVIAVVYAYFARRESPLRALAFAAGGVFLSAAWSYIFFPMAEAFYCALIATFLYLWFTDRPKRAALAGGIAFGAQMPLAALALPFLWDLARRRAWRSSILAVLVVLACVVPQLAYNLLRLGGPVPMRLVGASAVGFIEWGTVARTLFDPSMGVFWFYPVALYGLLNARYDGRTILILVAVGLIAVAMSSVVNIYSHQIGIRFGNYVFPAFLFIARGLDVARLRSRVAMLWAVALGAGLAMNPLGNSALLDIRPRTFLGYRVMSSLGTYRENPEVFAAGSATLAVGRVFARETFPDGWTVGGERAQIMITEVGPGPLELTLGSWGAHGPQRVRVHTRGGRLLEGHLSPNTATTVRVSLSPEDVVPYGRWGDGQIAFLVIEAEPWIPAWDAPQGTSDDARRLGCRLLAMSWGGSRLAFR